MSRRSQPSRDVQWQIRSVTVRARDGPQRVELAYRILIGDGLLDQHQTKPKEVNDARGDLCQGVH